MKLEAWSLEQGARSQMEIDELKSKSAEVDGLKAKIHAFEERLNSLPPAP
jgi:FtsZ-binding cell division protein ZapB